MVAIQKQQAPAPEPTSCYISPERVQAVRAQITARLEDEFHAQRLASPLRERREAKGLEFPLPEGPLVVELVDDIQHTEHIPTCDDPDCPCHIGLQRQITKEYEAAKAAKKRKRNRTYSTPTDADIRRNEAALNGNRPFQIMYHD